MAILPAEDVWTKTEEEIQDILDKGWAEQQQEVRAFSYPINSGAYQAAIEKLENRHTFLTTVQEILFKKKTLRLEHEALEVSRRALILSEGANNRVTASIIVSILVAAASIYAGIRSSENQEALALIQQRVEEVRAKTSDTRTQTAQGPGRSDITPAVPSPSLVDAGPEKAGTPQVDAGSSSTDAVGDEMDGGTAKKKPRGPRR